ncbi:MAG: hypothetical protein ACT4N2_05990 [Hyphomicrobium sp.]
MTLSAPTIVTWLASSLLAVTAVAIKFFQVGDAIPTLGPLVNAHLFESLLAAYGLLWIGTVFRRI